jgi:hypothetical protein
MTELARGHEQVRALEHAIGGPPPTQALERSHEELVRLIEEESRARQSRWTKAADSSKSLRELTLARIAGEGSELVDALAENARQAEQRRLIAPVPPQAPAIEPQLAVGSIQLVKSPPYDQNVFATNGATGAEVSAAADASTGRYHVHAASIGQGTVTASAAVGVFFHAPVTNPSQRVAANLLASYAWQDAALFHVAHNDATTRLCVWGVGEERWLVLQPVEPGWSNGVSWLQERSGHEEGANVAIEAFFPAIAGNTYVAWVVTNGSVYADGSSFGRAFSEMDMQVFARFVVFGSL